MARMKPPAWPEFPCGERFSQLYAKAPMTAIEAARANAHALASMLGEVGVNVDCLPVLDVRQPGADDVIGDRALGEEPMQVAALGRAVLDGLKAGGVVGVVKHMPGHGRAMVDSHKLLRGAGEQEASRRSRAVRTPRARAEGHDLHLLLGLGTLSGRRAAAIFIGEIIRGRIGFDGFLMTDDLGMKALAGGFGERTRRALDAGCDAALHCSGAMEEMVAVASEAGALSAKGIERLERAMASVGLRRRRPDSRLWSERDRPS